MLVIERNLPFLRSWLAWALATVYVVTAALIIRWEWRNTGGGWINLRTLGTNAVTAPSQFILGPSSGSSVFRPSTSIGRGSQAGRSSRCTWL